MADAPVWTAGPETTKEFARLSGDYNPIHLESSAARAAGFEDIVVHGMCVLGVTQQAARSLAPEGLVLRRMDARFSGPVLPGKAVLLHGEVKEKEDGTARVAMKPEVDGKAVISPANFTFAPADAEWPVPPRFDPSHDEGDVLGAEQVLSAADIADYTVLVTPEGLRLDGVPPMACLLTITDALAKAYGNRKPPKPGAWVHLRQQGDFYRDVLPDRSYDCRIQESRAVLRKSNVGFQVVINFTVEETESGILTAGGTVTLMYMFDTE